MRAFRLIALHAVGNYSQSIATLVAEDAIAINLCVGKYTTIPYYMHVCKMLYYGYRWRYGDELWTILFVRRLWFHFSIW